MENIQIFKYNNTPMEFEVINGEVFANATIMCQAFSKRPSHWLELEHTKRYILALENSLSLKTALTETRNGGVNSGTWIHEKLIIKLASWLDVSFEIWCNDKIAELLRTGRVELQPKQLSKSEIAFMLYESELANEKLILKVDNLSTALDTLVEWVSIIKVSRFNKIHESVFNWRLLKRKSEEMGFLIKKSESPRFGFQNLYHVNAFRACYPQFNYKFLSE